MRWYRSRLIWLLSAAVLILLIGAALGWGIFVALRQRAPQTFSWRDPLAAISQEDILPELALYTLAGASVSETIDASIDSGELETAYALTVHSQDLSDAQRIGRLLLLGDRFAGADSRERAELCYGQVLDVAILSPRLSESVRQDSLLAVGKGWLALGNESRARTSFDAAHDLAVEGTYQPSAHRREQLVRLETAYRELGDAQQADACLAQIQMLDREPRPGPPQRTVEWSALPAAEAGISSPEVGVLEEARRQAAYALLQAVPEADDARVENLAQALREEDAAKMSLYSEGLQATTQSGRRCDIQTQIIGWLLLKLQVADGGFGMLLVPEWNSQVAEIRSALSSAFQDLSLEHEDVVMALPQASQMEPARYELTRRLALAGRLGFYPDWPVERVVGQLEAAVTALISSGLDDMVYVAPLWDASAGLAFEFSPADQYGGRP